MHGPLRKCLPIVAAIHLFVFVGFAPVSAAIEQTGHDRWVPSLAATSGVSFVGLSGSVASYDEFGDPLRPAASGRDYDVSPLLGADLELMSPQISLPLSPRLFVSGEVGAIFGVSRDIARESSATGARGPTIPPPPQGQTLPGVGYTIEEITGLGSKATTQLDKLYFGAGLGVAVPFEWFDRPMRLKVSAEYLWFRVDYDGLVTDAVCLPSGTTTRCADFDPVQPPTLPGFPPPPDPPPVDGYTRAIMLTDSTTNSYNALGPSIELEFDTGEFRSFTHSLFIGARAYRIIGDRSVRSTSLSDQQTYDDEIGLATYDAEWDYKIDRWMYRIVLGLRFGFTGP